MEIKMVRVKDLRKGQKYRLIGSATFFVIKEIFHAIKAGYVYKHLRNKHVITHTDGNRVYLNSNGAVEIEVKSSVNSQRKGK